MFKLTYVNNRDKHVIMTDFLDCVHELDYVRSGNFEFTFMLFDSVLETNTFDLFQGNEKHRAAFYALVYCGRTHEIIVRERANGDLVLMGRNRMYRFLNALDFYYSPRSSAWIGV